LLRCDSANDNNIAPVDFEQDEIEGCSPDNDAAKNHKPSTHNNDESGVPLRLRDGRPMAIGGRFSHTLGSAAIVKVESTQGR
jgi:hypothetical protein